jgi:hypothetical protein
MNRFVSKDNFIKVAFAIFYITNYIGKIVVSFKTILL